ncbi:type VI secretion protein VgrG [Massilia aurea]|uniref:Type VI secretion protein VgrG n=1 Tax=Massilia aurea TaxID=373040 RepID=A0A422QQQ1_9BURK|nr:type VI secretion system tip protein VgrG [Massilia aurea]RNF32350.1 type VI secretion protein VgrG [Massilia aurea]
MAQSPLENSKGDVKVVITCDGTALSDKAQILTLEVTHAVNRIPSARIILLDDSEVDANQRLALSDGDLFKPGAAVEIKAGHGSAADVIFSGIVIRHGVRIGPFGRSRLVVECRDKAIKMTVGRRSANFVDMSDDAILSKLIKAHGLDASVDSTTVTYKELVQFEASDWDFVLARAEANGLLALVDAGKVILAAPDTSTAAALSVKYGTDLLEFDGDVDARSQLTAVGGVAWDPSTQDVVEQSASPATLNSQGDLDGTTLAGVLGLDNFRLQSAAALDSEGLKAWTAARQMRAGLARVRGRMRFVGSALAKPGTLLTVSGAGKRFDGDAWLSSVTHMIAEGDWTTEAEFGLAPETPSERGELGAPQASGLTAGVSGLQVGVVLKLDEDPEAQYKIQVSLPVTKAETAGVWARLAGYYASDGIGNFFIPEIGDEVVLGFLNADPSHPVILGSLYSSKRKAPYELTSDNFTKAIVTRSKLKVEFDDDKKSITITTPAENKIVLSDDAKSILLQDQTGNKVTLDTSGITLDSPKDIAITAKGKITLDAVGNVALSSKADIKHDALNIASTAKVALTAKGSASAELSASGQTTVKGALVMIN